jgi:transcription factor C subunit 3
MGAFYYRPMDQILHRITDFPTVSQPPQYLQFAVIRETSITGRHTHYRYFSWPSHQKLVQEGLASEPWVTKNKKKGLKQGSGAGAGKVAPLEQDNYGFTPVNSARLLKNDGSAKLADSQDQIKKKENMKTPITQFKVSQGKEGEETIDWKNATRKYLLIVRCISHY